MRLFLDWLYCEDLDATGVRQILAGHHGLSVESLRTDIIDSHLKHGGKVNYHENYPISEIGQRRQGFVRQKAQDMIGSMLRQLGLPPDSDTRPHLEQIKAMLPPVIISVLPDGTNYIQDGNHRLGVSLMLGLPTIKTFLLTDQ